MGRHSVFFMLRPRAKYSFPEQVVTFAASRGAPLECSESDLDCISSSYHQNCQYLCNTLCSVTCRSSWWHPIVGGERVSSASHQNRIVICHLWPCVYLGVKRPGVAYHNVCCTKLQSTKTLRKGGIPGFATAAQMGPQ